MSDLSAAHTPVASHPQPAWDAGFGAERDAPMREPSEAEILAAWKHSIAGGASGAQAFEGFLDRRDAALEFNDQREPDLVRAAMAKPFQPDAILSLLAASQAGADSVANQRDRRGLAALNYASTNGTLDLSDPKAQKAFRALVAATDTTRPIPHAAEPLTFVDWAARGNANPVAIRMLSEDLARRDEGLLRGSINRYASARDPADDHLAPQAQARTLDSMACALDPKKPESETLQSTLMERFPGQLPKTLAVVENHLLSAALASPEGRRAMAEATAAAAVNEAPWASATPASFPALKPRAPVAQMRVGRRL